MIKLTLTNPLTSKARPRFNRKTGKAYHDKNYKNWLDLIAGKINRLLQDQSFPEFYCLYYCFQLKNERKIDLDNLTGSINDALVIGKALKDDSIKELKRYWVESTLMSEKERIIIYVCESITDYLKLYVKLHRKEIENEGCAVKFNGRTN
jgi:Holliday junction resolvase RusA-like endonuclease